jgi:hypothetical protein
MDFNKYNLQFAATQENLHKNLRREHKEHRPENRTDSGTMIYG